MRTCLIAIIMEACCAGIAQAHAADSAVSGCLFLADGSPAALTQVNVVSVIRSGHRMC